MARYFSNRCSNHTYQPRNNRCRNNHGTHTATAAHSQLSIQRRSRLSNCLCGCNALQLPLITSPETRERNIFGFGFRPLFRHGPPLLSLAPPASTSALIGGYKYWDLTCLRDCSGSRHPRIVTATTRCLACPAVGFWSCHTA